MIPPAYAADDLMCVIELIEGGLVPSSVSKWCNFSYFEFEYFVEMTLTDLFLS